MGEQISRGTGGPLWPPGGETPSPGAVLDGKYRLEKEIGSGGMGIVFSAEHLVLSQRVAIKFLLPTGNDPVLARRRFLREARNAASLGNRHVVRVQDAGETESGSPYFVMELLEGEDLATLARNRGPMAFEEAADVVLQVCDAIAEAHSAGIVHRDLKPQNVFVLRRRSGIPFVKVVDFGLSRAGDAVPGEESGITRTGSVIGSTPYMSPEQLRGLSNAGPPSDIWSLGVILYELVAGKRPFVGQTVQELCVRIGADAPTSVRLFRASVPRAIESLIADCLQKDPALRPASTEEVARRLAPFASAQARHDVDISFLPVGRDADPAQPPSAAAPLPDPSVQSVTQPVPGQTPRAEAPPTEPLPSSFTEEPVAPGTPPAPAPPSPAVSRAGSTTLVAAGLAVLVAIAGIVLIVLALRTAPAAMSDAEPGTTLADPGSSALPGIPSTGREGAPSAPVPEVPAPDTHPSTRPMSSGETAPSPAAAEPAPTVEPRPAPGPATVAPSPEKALPPKSPPPVRPALTTGEDYPSPPPVPARPTPTSESRPQETKPPPVSPKPPTPAPTQTSTLGRKRNVDPNEPGLQ